MKQTIAELGINNFGWIIYNDFFHPKQIVYVQVVEPCTEEPETLMPRYFVKEYFKYTNTPMSRTLTVFGNEIAYSTYVEAEEELKKEVNSDSLNSLKELTELSQKINELGHPTYTETDLKKTISQLLQLKTHLNETTNNLKKNTETFIKNINNIAEPQPDNIDWKQIRINASINFLSAILETTKHSVTEEPLINKIYARIAIGYADALIKELKKK